MDANRTGRHRLPEDRYRLSPRDYAAAAGAVVLGLLLSGASAAIATTPPAALMSAIAPPAPPVPTVLEPAKPAQPMTLVTATPTSTPVWSVKPNPGEGMISVVTRVCGADRVGTWRANALTNGIKPPLWIVRADTTLQVDCDAEVLPPDPTEAAPVASPTPSEPAPAGDNGWRNPLPGACIGSGFRTSSRPGHNGLDLPAAEGTPIYAAAAGTVTTSVQIYYDANGNPQGAGNYTVIDHGGVWTVYMHQSIHTVYSGWVEAGQQIGRVGSTGGSTGPHLHFEVHTSLWNTYLDPAPWMVDRGVGWGWC